MFMLQGYIYILKLSHWELYGKGREEAFWLQNGRISADVVGVVPVEKTNTHTGNPLRLLFTLVSVNSPSSQGNSPIAQSAQVGSLLSTNQSGAEAWAVPVLISLYILIIRRHFKNTMYNPLCLSLSLSLILSLLYTMHFVLTSVFSGELWWWH